MAAAAPCTLTTANLHSLDRHYYNNNSHIYKPVGFRGSPPSVTSSDMDSDMDDLDDAASLFSAPTALLSSVSSAPDDNGAGPETAPYELTTSGETVIVYQSLDQAVRYSLLRVEEQRRQQAEALFQRPDEFGGQPEAPQQYQPLQYQPGAVAAAVAAAATPDIAQPDMGAPQDGGVGSGYDDDDEDAYFSIG